MNHAIHITRQRDILLSPRPSVASTLCTPSQRGDAAKLPRAEQDTSYRLGQDGTTEDRLLLAGLRSLSDRDRTPGEEHGSASARTGVNLLSTLVRRKRITPCAVHSSNLPFHKIHGLFQGVRLLLNVELNGRVRQPVGRDPSAPPQKCVVNLPQLPRVQRTTFTDP